MTELLYDLINLSNIPISANSISVVTNLDRAQNGVPETVSDFRHVPGKLQTSRQCIDLAHNFQLLAPKQETGSAIVLLQIYKGVVLASGIPRFAPG